MSKNDNSPAGVGCGCIIIFFVVILSAIGILHEGSRNGVECLGLDDNAKKLPGYEYEISTRKVILGIIGIESLVIPAYIILSDIQCPVPKVKP